MIDDAQWMMDDGLWAMNDGLWTMVLGALLGGLDTIIVNVFAGVQGLPAPAFAGGAGGGQPPASWYG